ncbi:GNAT family N-acetyltransferase [Nocardia sp. NPDC058640]|uniref:GNAT family N-acetyltransferase n=1 Tax=Nocardia sp. NPDC058640 TaxID=3346571 RepID=UPI003669C4C5
MTAQFVSTRLAEDHDLSTFDSGHATLDDWLRSMAQRACVSGTARVYVWTPEGEQKVVAFFALTPTLVNRDEDGVPSGAAGGVSRIPGYLIGRLALDRSFHGQGFGAELLYDAVSKAVAAAEVGGGRLIVVDAIDDAAAQFYRKYGFTPVRHTPRRLVMKIATARSALGIG